MSWVWRKDIPQQVENSARAGRGEVGSQRGSPAGTGGGRRLPVIVLTYEEGTGGEGWGGDGWGGEGG